MSLMTQAPNLKSLMHSASQEDTLSLLRGAQQISLEFAHLCNGQGEMALSQSVIQRLS